MLKTYLVLCYFFASDGQLYQQVCYRAPTLETCKLYAHMMGDAQAPGHPAKCVVHEPSFKEVR